MIYELIISKDINGDEIGRQIKRTDEIGNVSWIPADEDNMDYQSYLQSLELTDE